jgi:hypothetical protein
VDAEDGQDDGEGSLIAYVGQVNGSLGGQQGIGRRG